jgi:hypothetical protein
VSLFRILWCRFFYGHVMVPYGVDSRVEPKHAMYMCARCLLCERLHRIGEDKDAA